MKALSIQFKVTMLVVISLVLTAVVSTLVVAFLMHNEATERLEGTRAVMTREKVEALSDKVKIAYHVVNSFYEALQNDPDKTDPSVVKAYQEKAKIAIKKLRFGEDGYFWINDFTPKMVMHPIKPALDGTNLSQSKDPKGKFLFNEMVDVATKNGKGVVNYMWKNQGLIHHKPKFRL